MATQTKAREVQEHEIPSEKKLEQLYELIDGIQIAMMTTRAPDGSLVSRPMATQARAAGTDLWFVTNVETAKIDELIADPHVNLGYYRESTREYVSVSGLAHVTQDRARIHELYKPDWRAWFGDEGGERDGGPNDPRLALIEVEAQSASYLKVDNSRIVTLFKVMKGIVSGQPPHVGTVGELDRKELRQGAGRA